MSDAASGTMSGTYTFRGIKASSTTDIYVYKITGELEINKYGSKALTSQLIVDNFITPSAGSGDGSGGSLPSTTFITIQPGTNLTDAVMTRHSITEGSTAHDARFTGTFTLTGNWDGNTAQDVRSGLTLSSKTQIDGIYSYLSTFTFTGGGYTGTGSNAVASGSTTTGEINYTIEIDSNSGSGTASASDVSTGYDFTMNVDGGTFSAP